MDDSWNVNEQAGEIKVSEGMSLQCGQIDETEETQAVVTRRMARDENKTRKPLVVIEELDSAITRDEFIKLQRDDETLKVFWDRSRAQEAYKELKLKEAKFIVKAEVLYRQYKHTDGITFTQLLLPMEILRELWTKENMEGEIKTTYEYVVDLRNRIADTCELARTELAKAQEKQRNYYNRRAVKRELKVGGKTLVLRADDNNKLLMHWHGPYKVTAKENENDYRIDMDGKSRLYHINMLKEYVERDRRTVTE